MKLAILCPITSRGCGLSLHRQPIFAALLPSMNALEMWGAVDLYLGYDDIDPVWRLAKIRNLIERPVTWVKLRGLAGNITGIWNELAKQAGPQQYILAANDDLAFQTSPLVALGALAARNDFGTVAFADEAFPGLPTFYVVGWIHFEIFGQLYPLPWTGAHQDPWIADVYRPWQASEIDERIRVHNRIGIARPRFEYGAVTGYRAEVMKGRQRVNEWLKANPGIAAVLDDIDSAPLLISEAA